jgi:hypothetical protein
MFNNVFFFENRTVYEIMSNNTVESGRPQMTIRCMSIACWVSKAPKTHSEYAIPIAFPLEQWLRESALVLRYKQIACLVVLP